MNGESSFDFMNMNIPKEKKKGTKKKRQRDIIGRTFSRESRLAESDPRCCVPTDPSAGRTDAVDRGAADVIAADANERARFSSSCLCTPV